MLVAGWAAWRLRMSDPALTRAAALAGALTVFLSILGAAAGQNPSPLAAAGNLLGGLALAATFAWTVGRAAVRPGEGGVAHIGGVLALLAAQCVLGAWVSQLSAESLWSFPLFAHAMLGAAVSALAAWLALRLDAPPQRFTFLGAALAAPAAGLASAMFGQPLAAMLAHAAAAALLAAAAAYVHGRFA